MHINDSVHLHGVSHGEDEDDPSSDSSDFESCDGDSDLNERMRDLDVSTVSQVSR